MKQIVKIFAPYLTGETKFDEGEAFYHLRNLLGGEGNKGKKLLYAFLFIHHYPLLLGGQVNRTIRENRENLDLLLAYCEQSELFGVKLLPRIAGSPLREVDLFYGVEGVSKPSTISHIEFSRISPNYGIFGARGPDQIKIHTFKTFTGLKSSLAQGWEIERKMETFHEEKSIHTFTAYHEDLGFLYGDLLGQVYTSDKKNVEAFFDFFPRAPGSSCENCETKIGPIEPISGDGWLCVPCLEEYIGEEFPHDIEGQPL